MLGLPDADWGEVVTAVYVPIAQLDATELQTALKPHLTAFKQPKRWIDLEQLPRNAQGKIDREQLKQLIG
ncbi:AMP-binding enzyme [Egbenema bharatensis]|uniref:AMP-binding enzyme n=1 Tax=Egbenema bharatensis TaxID=3463334 RepID=UPI003A84E340